MDPSTRFELLESVGRDELGEVFKAEEKTTGRAAAVKLFDEWTLASETARNAYSESLLELRRIQPVRTPPVAAFHVGDKSAWIASRWVSGQTLDDLLNEQGTLDLDTACGIMCGLLDALDELHSAGKAHGGLSPKKIILLDGVNPGGVILTDPFQHHLYSVDDPIKTSRNDPDRFLGLPQYFSPEQAQGGAPDTRSDVYVVGLLLYQLITGKAPFLARSVSTTLKRQIYEKPLPPRYAKPGLKIPKDAETIVYTALSKDADQRFQVARAFRRAINNLREVVSEDEERLAAPLGLAPIGVLAGLPVPDADRPMLDALREVDDELEGAVSGANSKVADEGDDGAEDESNEDQAGEDSDAASSDEPTASDEANQVDSGAEDSKEDDDTQEAASEEDATAEDSSVEDDAKEDDAKEDDAKEDDAKEDDAKEDDAKEDDAKEDDAKEDDGSTKGGTLVLSAVDALAAAEDGGRSTTDAIADGSKDAKDDAKEADGESKEGTGPTGTMMLNADATKAKAKRSFKRKKPRRKRVKTRNEPSVVVADDAMVEKVETPAEDANPATAGTVVLDTPEVDNADAEESRKDEGSVVESKPAEKSGSKSKRKRRGSKRRRSGASGVPAPPVPEDSQPVREFSEDSGELGWFAIGEDSQALKDLAVEIEEVEDHDQVHNRRFVIGLAALLAAGIFGVMIFSALFTGDGEEDDPEVSDADAEEVEDGQFDEPDTGLAAVTEDTAAPDPLVEEGSADEGSGNEGSGDEGSGEALDAGDVGDVGDASDADATGDTDTALDGADAVEEAGTDVAVEVEAAAPDVAPEEDTATEEEEPIVAAVEPEEEPEQEPEEAPEPEIDPEEAEREVNRARAREVLREAQSALDSRNHSEAETLFEEVISLDDSIASAHAGLGDVNFEQRNYSQAARHHRRATLLASRNADYHRKLGMDYFRLDNYNAALASFEEAVALGDSSASRYVSLVRERMEPEEPEEAPEEEEPEEPEEAPEEEEGSEE